MADRTTEAPALFQSERQREIVGLTMHGRAELADYFRVTTETIRRDLAPAP